ncbi:hypothetical protein TPA0909_51710 [Streptomyces albus]|nr:hypothetical protein TPA0909_51710 [Streptomyces albus]
MITNVSLGTTGKNPSSIAIPNSAAYTHGVLTNPSTACTIASFMLRDRTEHRTPRSVHERDRPPLTFVRCARRRPAVP